ncbi:MAG: isoaspartyl peptidase/L-asparaginase, partial [Pyrinomonadaceae bacterium]|nr:isoaspartyl peptidase/L-asparaginase [Pyrinomonadaceae bacterium]
MINRRKFLQLPLLGAPIYFARDVFGQDREKASTSKVRTPVVVSTWDSGMTPNRAAWPMLQKGGKAIDAVEAAGRASEGEPSCCVGLEAFPDRDGKVTLDASI